MPVDARHLKTQPGSAPQVQRQIRMSAALSAINEAILRAESRAQLRALVCQAALLDGEFVATAIMMLEPPAVLKLAACAGQGLDFLRDVEIPIEPAADAGRSIAREAFITQKPAFAADVSTDAHLRDQHAAADGILGCAVALPLLHGGQSVGVLIVGGGQRALDDETVTLLGRMVDNVSFVIDSFDREAERKSSERATRRLARMFAALSATNEAILRAKTPDELYQRVCDAAVHGGQSLASAVLLVEPGSHWLKPVAGTGAMVDLLRQTRFSVDADDPYGKGVCGIAFRTRKPSINNDIGASEQARPWHAVGREMGVVACAAMPLIKGGESIGVLMFFISRSWASDEEVIALLARMAENTSFALDNFAHEENRRQAEARARFLATHDDLTGLPNRAMFSQTLDQAIKAAQRYDGTFSVMFVDLDRFKIINDTLGHAAGDILLKETATRLGQCLRESDVVARLGGDEFVVLLREIADTDQAGTVARKILSALVKPIVIHGQECRVSASIGIAMFPADAQDEETLTRNADAAMYLAKEEGRNAFRFFSKEIKTQSIERLMLETSLRRALERDEFLLHYQAKQNLETGDISGVEALLRWRHPDLGLLPPAQFIPLAEETGLIIPIGKWVLDTACAQNMAWQAQGLSALPIAVNLSPRQFASERLLSDIGGALAQSGMPPELLELEITESMVMHNVERALRLLVSIKKLGIRLAIDDFGTGYSSMSLIKQFPIDTIKVDRSFVRQIPGDANDRAITEAIISLGKALHLTIVAEGVETRSQETFLREHDCDEIQGYLFSKPIPGDDFVGFVAEHNLSRMKAQTAGARRRAHRGGATKGRRGAR